MSGILNALLAGGVVGDRVVMTTVGSYSDSTPPILVEERGYRTVGRTYGAVSSDALKDSTTLANIYWYATTNAVPETTYLVGLWISGFSGDPGQDYISNLRIDGTPLGAGTSATYGYGGGTATWDWDVIGLMETSPFATNSVISIEY